MLEVTIFNLKDLTQQQVYSKVRNHLLTQKERAVHSPTSRVCKYRTPSGLTCAVGCLIPEDKYSAEFEGMMAGDLLWQLLNNGFRRKRTEDVDDWAAFLNGLQNIHDDCDPVYWEVHLDSFATSYGLQPC